jgi:RND family efflux transporter MFP subunit
LDAPLICRTIISGIILPAVLAANLACNPFSPAPIPTPAPDRTTRAITYRVIQVKETSQGSTLTYSGDVKSKTQVAVSAKMVSRIEELRVDMGSEVKMGDIIAVLEHSSLDAQLQQAEAALLVVQARLSQMEAGARYEAIGQAEANLDTMRQKLASAQAGSRAEAIAQAEANLHGAEARLAQILAGPTQEQIDVAKTNVRLAKNNLYNAQVTADAYRGAAQRGTIYTEGMKAAVSGVGFEQVQLAEAQLAQLLAKPQPEVVAQAQAQIDAARQQLKLMKDPLTEWDLAQLLNAVRAAEQQVSLARSPYTVQDLDVARAQVKQAQTAIDLVQTQLGDTVVVAPFDGVVSERVQAVGALASPGTPIVNLISSEIEIILTIEEARSGVVKAGMPATIQVGAYPNQTFQGVVSSIAPTLDPKTRTLVVKVSPKDEQKQLKPGMYARVNLSIGQAQTVISIPRDAVVKRSDKDTVFLVINGKAVAREVQVGTADAANIQILKGIAVGDTIVQNPGSTLQDGEQVTQ